MKDVQDIETQAKLSTKRKIEFSKKSKIDLLEALNAIPDVSDNEIDHVIQEGIARLTDDVSYTMFGAKLASNLGSDVRVYRARIYATEKQKNKQLQKQQQDQWKRKLAIAQEDVDVDLNHWWDLNTPCDICEADSEFENESSVLFQAAQDHQARLCDADEQGVQSVAPDVPMKIDPDWKKYKIKDVFFRADSRAGAVFAAQQRFQIFSLTEKDIIATSPAMRPITADETEQTASTVSVDDDERAVGRA